MAQSNSIAGSVNLPLPQVGCMLLLACTAEACRACVALPVGCSWSLTMKGVRLARSCVQFAWHQQQRPARPLLPAVCPRAYHVVVSVAVVHVQARDLLPALPALTPMFCLPAAMHQQGYTNSFHLPQFVSASICSWCPLPVCKSPHTQLPFVRVQGVQLYILAPTADRATQGIRSCFRQHHPG